MRNTSFRPADLSDLIEYYSLDLADRPDMNSLAEQAAAAMTSSMTGLLPPKSIIGQHSILSGKNDQSSQRSPDPFLSVLISSNTTTERCILRISSVIFAEVIKSALGIDQPFKNSQKRLSLSSFEKAVSTEIANRFFPLFVRSSQLLRELADHDFSMIIDERPFEPKPGFPIVIWLSASLPLRVLKDVFSIHFSQEFLSRFRNVMISANVAKNSNELLQMSSQKSIALDCDISIEISHGKLIDFSKFLSGGFLSMGSLDTVDCYIEIEDHKFVSGKLHFHNGRLALKCEAFIE